MRVSRNDLRLAVRSFTRHRTFTAVAVLSLALAISLNTRMLRVPVESSLNEYSLNDRIVEHRRDELLLSTNRARLDLHAVLSMLLASHWGGSMTHPLLARAVENSVCVGVYSGERQVAFARVVTDLTTYAYLTDVIVADEMRGRGIGSWMVESIVSHPELQGLRRMALWTRNAPALYERFGFTKDVPPSNYMELRPKR